MTNNTEHLNGWIYFLQANEAVKIGFSREPKRRAASIQTAHHRTLEILATIPTSLIHEHEAHARFKHLRIRGEWFRAEKELLKFIEALKKGRNPCRTPARKKKLTSPEIGSLMALRIKYGADTPIGHRCSNLIGQIQNMETAEGDHRVLLAAAMKKQADDLSRLLAA